jgi:hypothetical protein
MFNEKKRREEKRGGEKGKNPGMGTMSVTSGVPSSVVLAMGSGWDSLGDSTGSQEACLIDRNSSLYCGSSIPSGLPFPTGKNPSVSLSSQPPLPVRA